MQGRAMTVSLSSTALAGGTKLPIEMQGDLTIGLGKQSQAKIYKNGQQATTTDTGFTFSFPIGLTAPLGVGQQRVMTLHDSQALGYFFIESADVGGLQWEGACNVSVQTVNSPTNDDVNGVVTVVAQGTPTRSVKV